MSQKKVKQARRLVKIVRRLLGDDYYILPRRVLEMERLPHYKEEFLNMIHKDLLEKE